MALTIGGPESFLPAGPAAPMLQLSIEPSFLRSRENVMSAFKSPLKIARRIRQMRRAARVARQMAVFGAAVSVGVGATAYALRRHRTIDLLDRVVVITGGSRGLGLALAEECARRGAKVAICARDPEELEIARRQVRYKFAGEVLADVCDVTRTKDVESFLDAVLSRFGQIDVLINNAGVISVGPAESQTLADYEEAMNTMYWGVVYPTLSALPHMKKRGGGRIANIASIGGKIAVPHLLPYTAAKFATVGFSEGLRSELLKDGIRVTTVCPGLMRTGSHLNAHFKGQHRREFGWFSFGATMPLVSIDVRRAARKIIAAIRAGDAELVITPQAKVAAHLHGLFPGLTTDVLGVVNRLLPKAGWDRAERHVGRESHSWLTKSFLQHMGERAAREWNQNGDSTVETGKLESRWQGDVSA